jgi:hypothetical protein
VKRQEKKEGPFFSEKRKRPNGKEEEEHIQYGSNTPTLNRPLVPVQASQINLPGVFGAPNKREAFRIASYSSA